MLLFGLDIIRRMCDQYDDFITAILKCFAVGERIGNPTVEIQPADVYKRQVFCKELLNIVIQGREEFGGRAARIGRLLAGGEQNGR